MKTFNQFQENIATSILKSKPAQSLLGKTTAGKFVRSMALPDKVADFGIPFTKYKLGSNKITQALNLPYKAGTDSMFMGPLAPLTFMGSLATRAYGPGLSKLGKAKEKARLETRKTMVGALNKSGDKNSQFNVDKYMSTFKGVNNKPLYPSLIPKI
tara:strand:- start:68 stop:535 length:468 start_codon:yes stop_codon:yes gene_type:complete